MEGKFRLLLSRVIFHSKDKMFAMNIHKLLWISNLESLSSRTVCSNEHKPFFKFRDTQEKSNRFKMKCDISNYKQYMTTITRFVPNIVVVIVSESTSFI